MRNLSKYIGIFLILMHPLQGSNLSGKSFLSAQPFSFIPTDITHSTVFDQEFEDGSVLNKTEISAVVFGGKSTNKEDLNTFFLIKNKSSLLTNEDPVSDTSSFQDIIGYNFNIMTTLGNQSSVISFNPKQTFSGFGISARYGFKERWWATAEVPFINVSNDLGLDEAILETGGSINTTHLGLDGLPVNSINMTNAFKQPGLLYGRIDGAQSSRGLGDIFLQLGYDFMDRKTSYLAPYIGVIIPTSNRPNAVYLWEPIRGNNKHAGIILGAYGHTLIHEKNGAHIWFTWSSKNQYLVENKQKRSFDLNRGQWTRYLAMYKNEADRNSTLNTMQSLGKKTFGINLMTQDVYVTPGFSNYSTFSFSFIQGHFNATIGTTSFIRESENIRFVNDWILGPEVADFSDDNSSNLLSTIGSLASSGAVAGGAQIKYEDIDLTSAANTNLFVNSLYGTLGYYTASEHPFLCELGGSYEVSKQNNAIDRFTFWGKFQITF